MTDGTTEATSTYTVTGMSCAHCAHAVADEVTDVTGVRDVDVDLETGLVAVTGDDVADSEIADAVERAGYELASHATRTAA